MEEESAIASWQEEITSAGHDEEGEGQSYGDGENGWQSRVGVNGY